jgi:hypothetical protein
MSWMPSDWRMTVQHARWIRGDRLTGSQFRCGVCRNDFIAPPEGAATFIDQHFSIRLTVCKPCEALLDGLKPLGR